MPSVFCLLKSFPFFFSFFIVFALSWLQENEKREKKIKPLSFKSAFSFFLSFFKLYYSFVRFPVYCFTRSTCFVHMSLHNCGFSCHSKCGRCISQLPWTRLPWNFIKLHVFYVIFSLSKEIRWKQNERQKEIEMKTKLTKCIHCLQLTNHNTGRCTHVHFDKMILVKINFLSML